MKLSISNIGWDKENDENVYELMKKYNFSGLEIAPTRIFPEEPYDKITEAKIWYESLKKNYDFEIPSMQSIWFGRCERIFASDEEREFLVKYTKKAIVFAESINCKNLVFGCPRNRNLLENENSDVGVSFFKEIGDYAYEHNTVIGMEANPTIYNTNYINDTASALELIENVNSKGFLLNLDLGTIIFNDENIDILKGKVKYINHIHISEPNLKPIEKRNLHQKLKNIIENEEYNKYISIEMGKIEELEVIEEKLKYIGGVFNA